MLLHFCLQLLHVCVLCLCTKKTKLKQNKNSTGCLLTSDVRPLTGIVPRLCSWGFKSRAHITHSSHIFTLVSRGSEEEKQVGLCNPCDPGPAHHHHYHRDPTCRRLRDNHGQRHQDHCHLCSRHHPQESKAVNTERAQSCLSVRVSDPNMTDVKLEDLCCPVIIHVKRCR